MKNEIWRPINIDQFVGLYEVSSHGRVRSLARTFTTKKGSTVKKNEKLLNPSKTSNGYLMSKFAANGEVKRYMTHRLVAMAFIENPSGKKEVNHKDGNKLNNNADNLEWVTPSENMSHALVNGLCKPRRGEQHQNAKLDNLEVDVIRHALSCGMSNTALAEIFDVHQTTICKIKKGSRRRAA